MTIVLYMATLLLTDPTSFETAQVTASAPQLDDHDITTSLENAKKATAQVVELIPHVNNTPKYIAYFVIFILTIYIVYMLYHILTAPAISGTWIDDKGAHHTIASSNVDITVDSISGNITDGYISLTNGETGVWDYKSRIKWTSGIIYDKM
jgi:hypothetical protein